MNNIPHLNLNDFLSGDSKTKNEFIEQLGKGFSEIGFIAIKGLPEKHNVIGCDSKYLEEI